MILPCVWLMSCRSLTGCLQWTYSFSEFQNGGYPNYLYWQLSRWGYPLPISPNIFKSSKTSHCGLPFGENCIIVGQWQMDRHYHDHTNYRAQQSTHCKNSVDKKRTKKFMTLPICMQLRKSSISSYNMQLCSLFLSVSPTNCFSTPNCKQTIVVA